MLSFSWALPQEARVVFISASFIRLTIRHQRLKIVAVALYSQMSHLEQENEVSRDLNPWSLCCYQDACRWYPPWMCYWKAWLEEAWLRASFWAKMGFIRKIKFSSYRLTASYTGQNPTNSPEVGGRPIPFSADLPSSTAYSKSTGGIWCTASMANKSFSNIPELLSISLDPRSRTDSGPGRSNTHLNSWQLRQQASSTCLRHQQTVAGTKGCKKEVQHSVRNHVWPSDTIRHHQTPFVTVL